MCMIVKIDKLSHEMRGIAKIDNKVTFVDKVIPNEVVNIRITKQKKNNNFSLFLPLMLPVSNSTLISRLLKSSTTPK